MGVEAEAGGVICPACGGRAHDVLETRAPAHDRFRRRRRCVTCSFRWSTVERVVKDARGSVNQPLRVALANTRDSVPKTLPAVIQNPTHSVLEGGGGVSLVPVSSVVPVLSPDPISNPDQVKPRARKNIIHAYPAEFEAAWNETAKTGSKFE